MPAELAAAAAQVTADRPAAVPLASAGWPPMPAFPAAAALASCLATTVARTFRKCRSIVSSRPNASSSRTHGVIATTAREARSGRAVFVACTASPTATAASSSIRQAHA